MAKGIDTIKKEYVKKGLLEGKSTKRALLEAGYSINTAVHSTSLSVVKCSQKEIKEDMEKKGWSVERLLEEIEWGIEQSKQKKQLSNHRGYCEILARHYLSSKEEIQQRFSFTPEELEELQRLRKGL